MSEVEEKEVGEAPEEDEEVPGEDGDDEEEAVARTPRYGPVYDPETGRWHA